LFKVAFLVTSAVLANAFFHGPLLTSVVGGAVTPECHLWAQTVLRADAAFHSYISTLLRFVQACFILCE
jgi:hypothetical protein